MDGYRVAELQRLHHKQRCMVLWRAPLGGGKLRWYTILRDDLCRTVRETSPRIQTGETPELRR
uniref:Uncharacterized protein n=1 Tax=Anguilla anguilla TaxID=7936 RepID=A0A0E9XD10_ANGAN